MQTGRSLPCFFGTGQSVQTTFMLIVQVLMIQAHQIQNRSVQITEVDFPSTALSPVSLVFSVDIP